MQVLYFLHIPRSSGSSFLSYVQSLQLIMKDKTVNGNWVDDNNNWINFWDWSEYDQLDAFKNIDIIFNESELGECFFTNDKVKYITILRNPYDIVISIFQQYFHYVNVNVKHNWINKDDFINEFNKFLHEKMDDNVRGIYKNYFLKFFYRHKCNDTNILKQKFLERIKYFNIIKFNEDYDKIHSLLYEHFRGCKNTNIPFPYKHKRESIHILTFDDLSDTNKTILMDLLKEDIEMYNFVNQRT